MVNKIESILQVSGAQVNEIRDEIKSLKIDHNKKFNSYLESQEAHLKSFISKEPLLKSKMVILKEALEEVEREMVKNGVDFTDLNTDLQLTFTAASNRLNDVIAKHTNNTIKIKFTEKIIKEEMVKNNNETTVGTDLYEEDLYEEDLWLTEEDEEEDEEEEWLIKGDLPEEEWLTREILTELPIYQERHGRVIKAKEEITEELDFMAKRYFEIEGKGYNKLEELRLKREQVIDSLEQCYYIRTGYDIFRKELGRNLNGKLDTIREREEQLRGEILRLEMVK